MNHQMGHESLHCYRLAVGVARWVRVVRWPRGEASLRDQARRSADSVVLNIAEGYHRTGGDRPKHFGYAAGSAAEVAAVLDIVVLADGAARQTELRRVVAMLGALAAR